MSIYDFRLCDNCETPYCWRSDRGKEQCGEFDEKYCLSCTDHYMKNVLKMPAKLIAIKRLQLAGKRFLRRKLEDYQLDIIKSIAKTKDHESHSTAQSIIRHINTVKRWDHRPATREANI